MAVKVQVTGASLARVTVTDAPPVVPSLHAAAVVWPGWLIWLTVVVPGSR